MVCLLLKGLVDHNGKMDALLKRTSSVKVDLFQVICLSIRSNSNEGLGSAGGGGGQKSKQPCSNTVSFAFCAFKWGIYSQGKSKRMLATNVLGMRNSNLVIRTVSSLVVHIGANIEICLIDLSLKTLREFISLCLLLLFSVLGSRETSGGNPRKPSSK